MRRAWQRTIRTLPHIPHQSRSWEGERRRVILTLGDGFNPPLSMLPRVKITPLQNVWRGAATDGASIIGDRSGLSCIVHYSVSVHRFVVGDMGIAHVHIGRLWCVDDLAVHRCPNQQAQSHNQQQVSHDFPFKTGLRFQATMVISVSVSKSLIKTPAPIGVKGLGQKTELRPVVIRHSRLGDP